MDNREIVKRIRELSKKRNAVLLAHNYQRPEIQDLADHTGDSLGLSIIASETDADVIVFCGVHFMAESAAILSPDKRVLLPRTEAGCPMADTITADQLKDFKADHPGSKVVTYVNSTAETKALSDICCTSANAVKVVNSVDSLRILFTPDRNLGHWASRHTDKRVISWRGFCPTHEILTTDEVLAAKEQHPDAELMAHPECRPEVLDLADAVLSTSGMLKYAGESTAGKFIVGTEVGLLHRLKIDNPQKEFVPASTNMVCPTMKMIRLHDVLAALENPDPVTVRVPEDVRLAAKGALDRMLAVPRDA